MRQRCHSAHSTSIADYRDPARVCVEHHRKMSHEKLSREIRWDSARIYFPRDSECGFATYVEYCHRRIDALIEVHQLFLARTVEVEFSGRVCFAVNTLVEKRHVP